MTAETDQRRGQPRSYDLRERKRTRTRLMIQAEALRLFGDKGYTQTTVEDIADAAAISPRTFFRYFPSKEDVVMWDEYDDPVALDLLAAQTEDEPLAETIRAVVRETLEGLYRHDQERLLTRAQLAVKAPGPRAPSVEVQTRGIEQLTEVFATRRGARVDELTLR